MICNKCSKCGKENNRLGIDGVCHNCRNEKIMNPFTTTDAAGGKHPDPLNIDDSQYKKHKGSRKTIGSIEGENPYEKVLEELKNHLKTLKRNTEISVKGYKNSPINNMINYQISYLTNLLCLIKSFEQKHGIKE